MENLSLDTFEGEFEGKKSKFLDFFSQKHPFIKIKNPAQFLVEAETISERYKENLTHEKHILIPELVTCLLEHNEFEQVFGYSHYNKYNISKQIYKFFYTSKFIGNILEKPSIMKMLSLWRLSL